MTPPKKPLTIRRLVLASAAPLALVAGILAMAIASYATPPTVVPVVVAEIPAATLDATAAPVPVEAPAVLADAAASAPATVTKAVTKAPAPKRTAVSKTKPAKKSAVKAKTKAKKSTSVARR